MAVESMPCSRVFLALRPYQIVLSHIVLEQEQTEFGHHASAHLICHGCGESPGDKLLIDNESWDEVHLFSAVSGRLGIRAAVDRWAGERFDAEKKLTAYVSNDTGVTTQLLLSFFRNRRLVLMEDGIGSYVPAGWNNSLLRRLVRSVLYRPLYGARYFNTRGLATTRADRYYALSDRAFPSIAPSESAMRRIRVRDSRYMDTLRLRLAPALAQAFEGRPVYLLLSEPFLQHSDSTFATVVEQFARRISEDAPRGAFVWLKRHPAESVTAIDEKRKRLQSMLRADLIVGDPPECTFPAELSSLLGIDIRGVYGTLSSGLLNVRLLDPAVPVDAYHGLLSKSLRKRFSSYIDVMNGAGVSCRSI